MVDRNTNKAECPTICTHSTTISICIIPCAVAITLSLQVHFIKLVKSIYVVNIAYRRGEFSRVMQDVGLHIVRRAYPGYKWRNITT